MFSPIVAQQILLLVAILFFLFAYAPLDTSRVLGLPPTVRFTTQKHLVPFLGGFFIVSYGKTLPVSFSPPPPPSSRLLSPLPSLLICNSFTYRNHPSPSRVLYDALSCNFIFRCSS